MSGSSTRSRLTRRGLLKAALVVVPAGLAAATGGIGGLWATADVNTAGKTRFVNRLAVPPLAPSRRDRSGRRVYDLRAAVGSRRFRSGRATVTWGVNGDYLGPTLRAARGEKVLVNVRNELGEPTTMHWHGMHLPAAMDGGPHQMIEPGAAWSPTWTIDQPAATLWYHPHPHARTALHVYRGLAGLFIVDDPKAGTLGLPSRYGVDDVPVIVQDKKFTDTDQFSAERPMMGGTGILGDAILVNGTLAPFHEVTTQRTRLRLLNASTARVYDFGFSDDRPFALVGTDGGLLPAPFHTTRVQLSPGERAEIVVTLRPTERVTLRSYPPDLGTDLWNSRFTGGDDTLDILELCAGHVLGSSPALPGVLAERPDLETAGAVTRSFELGGHRINGRRMDMSRIDFAVAKDTTEIWQITNCGNTPHNFHVHDVQFQVLSVGGADPTPELSGWKDTVYVPPNAPVRIAVRFKDYTDPAVPYMYHCHLLYHEDQRMMGQFTVTDRGDAPKTSPSHGHHGA
ncbi:multicopper oxidase domain-containing protein [Actinomadura alba]|uniref:Multicopper oxidase domain-containing protein n=2 Tax=Actinomadura alba TaxID=406431 RepID=A0ABR7LPP0_9ACTN|nr:multicopper oxidase domain-containing protein [Actinomadura alba]